MFPKMLEDSSGSFVMEGKIILGVDAHVIHVDLKPVFCDHIHTYVVHECLEHGGCVGEPKEHDGWFE